MSDKTLETSQLARQAPADSPFPPRPNSQATALDALLFSQLHTILSLPTGARDSSVARLKETIQSEEVLVQWTKRVYDDFVKEKEVQWRDHGSEAAEKPLL